MPGREGESLGAVALGCLLKTQGTTCETGFSTGHSSTSCKANINAPPLQGSSEALPNQIPLSPSGKFQ